MIETVNDDDFDVWEEADDITGYIMIEINIDGNFKNCLRFIVGLTVIWDIYRPPT